MKCIYCKDGETTVYDSASTDKVVLRRRRCLSCGKRFFTEERAGESQNGLNTMLNSLKESRRKDRKDGVE